MDVKQISNILLELGNNFKSSPACPILLIIESYMQNKSVLNFEIEIELRLAKGIFTEIILGTEIFSCCFLSFISIYLNQEEWHRQFFYFLSLFSFRLPGWQGKAWMWMWIVFPFPFIVSDKIWRCGIQDPSECDIKVIFSIFQDLYLMWRYVRKLECDA